MSSNPTPLIALLVNPDTAYECQVGQVACRQAVVTVALANKVGIHAVVVSGVLYVVRGRRPAGDAATPWFWKSEHPTTATWVEGWVRK